MCARTTNPPHADASLLEGKKKKERLVCNRTTGQEGCAYGSEHFENSHKRMRTSFVRSILGEVGADESTRPSIHRSIHPSAIRASHFVMESFWASAPAANGYGRKPVLTFALLDPSINTQSSSHGSLSSFPFCFFPNSKLVPALHSHHHYHHHLLHLLLHWITTS